MSAAGTSAAGARPAAPRRRRWPDVVGLLVPPLALVAGWAVLLPVEHWRVNPDGVVYAALADRWAAGDVAGAVTTYWSPLLPALAAPLVALGVPTLLALRLVLLAAALAVLPLVRTLARRCGAGRRACDAVTLAAVPLLGASALFGVYPELLLALLLLAHCRCVLVARPGRRGLRDAVLAGLWGGLAYLAKAVGLPFVVTFVVVVALARLVRPDRPRADVVRAAAVTLGVAALVAGPWVAVVSAQAGHPTLSTAGSFNARFAAAGSWGSPLTYDGLYAPAPGDVTPWEDPPALPDLRDPAAEGEPITLVERVDNTVGQVGVAGGSLLRRWWMVLPLAAGGLVVALRQARHDRSPTAGRAGASTGATASGLTLAAAVLTGGLSLLVVIERYLWFPMLASLPVAAAGLQALLRGRAVPTAAAGVVLAGLVALPLLPSGDPGPGSGGGGDRQAWALAEELDGPSALRGPLAGTEDWERTQLLAYLDGVPYVGTTGTDEPAAEVAAQMRVVGAEHLVVWDDAPPGLPEPGPGPAVYDLTPAGLVPHES